MKCITEAKVAFNRYRVFCIFLDMHLKTTLWASWEITIYATRIFYRLQCFLELPEYQHPKNCDDTYPTGSIVITNASMAWDTAGQGTTKASKNAKSTYNK